MTRCIKYNRILVNEQATGSAPAFVQDYATRTMQMWTGGGLTQVYGHVPILFLGALRLRNLQCLVPREDAGNFVHLC